MRAVSRPLDEVIDRPVDLNDVARNDGYLFVRDGVGFAGRGVAARVPVDEAVEFLAAIEHDDRAGGVNGPIALGALPFRPGADADLVVPAVVVGKDESGRQWVTTIDDADETLVPPAEPVATSATWSIEPLVDTERYLAAVAAARDAVREGSLQKAVIARPIEVRSDRPIDVHAVLRRLKATFGSSHRFSIDGFIGASPELLVAVEGGVVSSFPLAGTTRTTGDDEVDAKLAAELHASEKNRIEHAAAIEMVRDTLLPFCSYLDWAPEPEIVKVANVQHLGSRAEGMLSKPHATVIELVRALQPTPAVGGHPREAAIELIERVEGFERGVYGGTVGWCDGHGDGRWAVSLRCAELSTDRRSARLVAGGGIVADSDPLSELAETQAKFQAMLSALIRP
ncbi:MAG: isochorismate synthase [Ilumatobacteraceae bacterium]